MIASDVFEDLKCGMWVCSTSQPVVKYKILRVGKATMRLSIYLGGRYVRDITTNKEIVRNNAVIHESPLW